MRLSHVLIPILTLTISLSIAFAEQGAKVQQTLDHIEDACGYSPYDDGTPASPDGLVITPHITNDSESSKCRTLMNKPPLSGTCSLGEGTRTKPCSHIHLRAFATDKLSAVEFKTDSEGHFTLKLSPFKTYRIESMTPDLLLEKETLAHQGEQISIRLIRIR
jgi:hypothetical protein